MNKFILIATIFTFISSIKAADKTLSTDIPGLQPATNLSQPKIKEIHQIVFSHWPLLAEEAPKIAGSFKTVRPIPEFSDRGDLIWEVRIIHLVNTPSGIIWINDRTKKCIVLGAPNKAEQ